MTNVDQAIPLMLKQLRLGALQQESAPLTQRAETEGWSDPRYRQALCETELGERQHRRIERILKHSRLPAGKSIEMLDQQSLSRTETVDKCNCH